ncbi:MAG: YckD family protein [Bacillota bacterium]
MHRFGITLMAAVLVFVAVLGVIPVLADDSLNTDSGNAAVQLTEAQKEEIAALHKGILEKQKEVISKYVEYGVITKEKGDYMISRLEKRYEKLEQNGFIPKWAKCNRKYSQ